VPIEVVFRTFQKKYYLDLLYADGAVFELKAAEALTERHRAQLLNYLLLLDLGHGKLVNLRNELVEHEFVNAPWRREDRLSFQVEDSGWSAAEDAVDLRELMIALVRDWGLGLENLLYEEAVTHFLGGVAAVVRPVEVVMHNAKLGAQTCQLLNPETAFKITSFASNASLYEDHLHRLLAHTALKRIQWINLGRKAISFRTVERQRQEH
jgi:hypothetical protein